jgi:hypothetical protein
MALPEVGFKEITIDFLDDFRLADNPGADRIGKHLRVLVTKYVPRDRGRLSDHFKKRLITVN